MFPPRGSGGIGRRASLRSLLEQSSGGSSPPFRTSLSVQPARLSFGGLIRSVRRRGVRRLVQAVRKPGARLLDHPPRLLQPDARRCQIAARGRQVSVIEPRGLPGVRPEIRGRRLAHLVRCKMSFTSSSQLGTYMRSRSIRSGTGRRTTRNRCSSARQLDGVLPDQRAQEICPDDPRRGARPEVRSSDAWADWDGPDPLTSPIEQPEAIPAPARPPSRRRDVPSTLCVRIGPHED